jgi:hypothetical protein
VAERAKSVIGTILVKFAIVNGVNEFAFSVRTSWPVTATCVHLDKFISDHRQRQVLFDIFAEVSSIRRISIRRKHGHGKMFAADVSESNESEGEERKTNGLCADVRVKK